MFFIELSLIGNLHTEPALTIFWSNSDRIKSGTTTTLLLIDQIDSLKLLDLLSYDWHDCIQAKMT